MLFVKSAPDGVHCLDNTIEYPRIGSAWEAMAEYAKTLPVGGHIVVVDGESVGGARGPWVYHVTVEREVITNEVIKVSDGTNRLVTL